jgi:hypothetical protein
MKSSFAILLAIFSVSFHTSCAPQREFVRFGDAGTFHPGPRNGSGRDLDDSETEYESCELIDHGAPNHGVPPMYSGQSSDQGGGYPAAVPIYDAYENPQTVIMPYPW